MLKYSYHRDNKYIYWEVIMTNAKAWDYSLGLIKVDGLKPTKDFMECIEKNKNGEMTKSEMKEFLDKKYKVKE